MVSGSPHHMQGHVKEEMLTRRSTGEEERKLGERS